MLVLLFLLSGTTFAQTNDNRAQSVYIEVLGAGGTFSLNYDTRFQNTQDGLGGRAGISFIASEGSSIFSVPVMLNYLLGNGNSYFEVGLGATYISFNADDEGDEVLFVDDSSIYGTMVFGYRYQPRDGGFLFRAGFAPIFNADNFIPYWPYLSFGYSF